jgi:hypothetical protein
MSGLSRFDGTGQRLARANPLQIWKQLLRSGGSLQEVATDNKPSK